jgi:hypothetical protein
VKKAPVSAVDLLAQREVALVTKAHFFAVGILDFGKPFHYLSLRRLGPIDSNVAQIPQEIPLHMMARCLFARHVTLQEGVLILAYQLLLVLLPETLKILCKVAIRRNDVLLRHHA